MQAFSYDLTKATVFDEAGTPFLMYGIEAIGEKKEVLLSFPDLFFHQQQAEAFVELCNQARLPLLQLPEVIEDVLAGL